MGIIIKDVQNVKENQFEKLCIRVAERVAQQPNTQNHNNGWGHSFQSPKQNNKIIKSNGGGAIGIFKMGSLLFGHCRNASRYTGRR